MYCNQCGAQIPEGSKFCNVCGAPVQTAASVWQPEPQPEIQAPPPKQTRYLTREWWFWVILMLAFVAFVLLAAKGSGYSYKSRSSSGSSAYSGATTATKALRELLDKNFPNSYSITSSSGKTIIKIWMTGTARDVELAKKGSEYSLDAWKEVRSGAISFQRSAADLYKEAGSSNIVEVWVVSDKDHSKTLLSVADSGVVYDAVK